MFYPWNQKQIMHIYSKNSKLDNILKLVPTKYCKKWDIVWLIIYKKLVRLVWEVLSP